MTTQIFTKMTTANQEIVISRTDDGFLKATLAGDKVYGSVLVKLKTPVTAANGTAITHVLGGPVKHLPKNPALGFTAAESETIRAASAAAPTGAILRERLVSAYQGVCAAAEAAADKGYTGQGYDPSDASDRIKDALTALREFDAAHPEMAASSAANKTEATRSFLASD